MTIRRKISAILGRTIQGDSWAPYVEELDREGKFTRRTMLAMMIQCCQSIEDLEIQLSIVQEQFSSPTQPKDLHGTANQKRVQSDKK